MDNFSPLYFMLIIFAIFFILYSAYSYKKNKPYLNLLAGSIILVFTIVFYPTHLDEIYKLWIPTFLFVLFVMLFVFSLMIIEIVKLLQGLVRIYRTHEWLRKSFHFIALILLLPYDYIYSIVSSNLIPFLELLNSGTVAYYIATLEKEVFLKTFVSVLIGVFLAVSLSFEFLRIHTSIISFPQSLLRKKEENEFAADVYLALSLLTLSILSSWTEFSAITLSVMVSDALGAIIGKHFGRKKLIGDRSLEGTIIEFITALILSSIYLDILSSITIAITIVFVDLTLALKINDNLLFPTLSLLAIRIVNWVV